MEVEKIIEVINSDEKEKTKKKKKWEKKMSVKDRPQAACYYWFTLDLGSVFIVGSGEGTQRK